MMRIGYYEVFGCYVTKGDRESEDYSSKFLKSIRLNIQTDSNRTDKNRTDSNRTDSIQNIPH